MHGAGILKQLLCFLQRLPPGPQHHALNERDHVRRIRKVQRHRCLHPMPQRQGARHKGRPAIVGEQACVVWIADPQFTGDPVASPDFRTVKNAGVPRRGEAVKISHHFHAVAIARQLARPPDQYEGGAWCGCASKRHRFQLHLKPRIRGRFLDDDTHGACHTALLGNVDRESGSGATTQESGVPGEKEHRCGEPGNERFAQPPPSHSSESKNCQCRRPRPKAHSHFRSGLIRRNDPPDGTKRQGSERLPWFEHAAECRKTDGNCNQEAARIRSPVTACLTMERSCRAL